MGIIVEYVHHCRDRAVLVSKGPCSDRLKNVLVSGYPPGWRGRGREEASEDRVTH